MAKIEAPIELVELLATDMIGILNTRREAYRQELADTVEQAVQSAMKPRLFGRQRTREEAEAYVNDAPYFGRVSSVVVHAARMLQDESWRERYSKQHDNLLKLRGLCVIARGTGKSTITLQNEDMSTLGHPEETYLAGAVAELRQRTASEPCESNGSVQNDRPPEHHPEPETKMPQPRGVVPGSAARCRVPWRGTGR
jgi:hypothetical protein